MSRTFTKDRGLHLECPNCGYRTPGFKHLGPLRSKIAMFR